ncbi:CSC1-like protein RXW8 [Ananas comosus]|uniref:CSC1-like protein RXW8 n=1 Tax=Ananas comosus TaxID=4615 RepID=A0A199UT57_ANACO|nr:CSC1-like protein RXW8 [Ananas comosus]
MKISALLTSAGINIGLCVLLLSLYSILRKQPGNVNVYFGRRLAQEHSRLRESFILERLVPSPSWIVKALQYKEEEILAIAGLDAVVFLRILVFRLWVHCVALYIISCAACILLYLSGAKKACKKFGHLTDTVIDRRCRPAIYRCGLCGGSTTSFQLYQNEFEPNSEKTDTNNSNLITSEEECASAFVFFKTRYAAIVASQVLQTSNPMIWVTDLAPEPDDVYWSNLWLPYKQLWIRRIATLLASIVFMFLFLIPVTFVQGLSQLDQLQQRFPFLKGILKKTFVTQLVTGYLPSVILQLFLYTVPPMMMLFSALEGPMSHSLRKKSACLKVLYFTIWNVFFVNVLSGSVISQLNVISSPKEIPTQLARAVPRQVLLWLQATFFITYVLTSGWASLSSEVMQLFGLIWNFIRRYVLRIKKDPTASSVPSFPYHTEIPKVLLFGLLGFTCSILAPLILPFLLVYFFLGYVVYRNQIINVYCSRYETGGLMWPIVHNTTVFSLLLTQIIAVGVFGLKESPVSAIFTILLDFIDKDREDEQSGRMEEIHQQLHSAYCQFSPHTGDRCHPETEGEGEEEGQCSTEVNDRNRSQDMKDGLSHPTLSGLPVAKLQRAVKSLSLIIALQNKSSTNV